MELLIGFGFRRQRSWRSSGQPSFAGGPGDVPSVPECVRMRQRYSDFDGGFVAQDVSGQRALRPGNDLTMSTLFRVIRGYRGSTKLIWTLGDSTSMKGVLPGLDSIIRHTLVRACMATYWGKAGGETKNECRW